MTGHFRRGRRQPPAAFGPNWSPAILNIKHTPVNKRAESPRPPWYANWRSQRACNGKPESVVLRSLDFDITNDTGVVVELQRLIDKAKSRRNAAEHRRLRRLRDTYGRRYLGDTREG